MADFRRIEPDRADGVTVLEHLIERAHRVRGAQVTQETGDEPVRDPKAPLRLGERPAQAVDDGAEGNAARSVRLWIEEDLRMDDALPVNALKIADGQVVEVVRIPQYP